MRVESLVFCADFASTSGGGGGVDVVVVGSPAPLGGGGAGAVSVLDCGGAGGGGGVGVVVLAVTGAVEVLGGAAPVAVAGSCVVSVVTCVTCVAGAGWAGLTGGALTARGTDGAVDAAAVLRDARVILAVRAFRSGRAWWVAMTAWRSTA